MGQSDIISVLRKQKRLWYTAKQITAMCKGKCKTTSLMLNKLVRYGFIKADYTHRERRYRLKNMRRQTT